MDPDLLAAVQALLPVLQSIDQRLASINTFVSSINGQVSAFDQIMLHQLAHVSHISTLPKPVWWDSVTASFGLTLPWGRG